MVSVCASGLTKDNLLTAEQLVWQQRDQELALTRERERAAKEKERQRRERDSIWSPVATGVGLPGGGVGLLSDHIEFDKESYSYVQFAREGPISRRSLFPIGISSYKLLLT